MQKLDAGGIIPKLLVNSKIPNALKAVQDAADEFRQDEKVDAAERRELAILMREAWEDEVYSEEEEALIQRVRQKFEGSLDESKWKLLKSPDIFVKMESIFEEEKNSAAVIFRATTVVDASLEECAAWELAKMTRERMKGHLDFGGLDREVVKLNNHAELFLFAMDLGVRGFDSREWLTKVVWKMIDQNTMITTVEDIEHDDFPIGANNHVRASSGCFWKYEQLDDAAGIPQTRVTYCQQADLKGFIPKALVNSKTTESLENLSNMRKKFDRTLDIDKSMR